MNLTLIRKFPGADSIIGELYIDGTFECYTLEDIERPEKIAGVTAIPRGQYEVTVTFSQRFQKELPLLLNVPNYEGVRIHTGNVATNTEGCILVGKDKLTNQIGRSRDAFNDLFPKLKDALTREKVFIEIKGE